MYPKQRTGISILFFFDLAINFDIKLFPILSHVPYPPFKSLLQLVEGLGKGLHISHFRFLIFFKWL